MRRKIALGTLVAVVVLSVTAAGFQARQRLEVKTVKMEILGPSETVYLLSGGGGNTMVVVDEITESVTLIDTKLSGWGQAIRNALHDVTDLPVKTIINTHADIDHAGGNGEFPTAVQIIAHENTKANLAKMDAFKGANAKFLPNQTYKDTLSLLDRPDPEAQSRASASRAGSNRIDLYYFGAGHTNGDTVVVFPAKRMVYMGDLFASKAVPIIDTKNGGSGVALPATLAKVVAELKDLNITRVVTGGLQAYTDYVVNYRADVPGARMLKWDDLTEYADFTRDFLAAVQEAQKAGKSVDQAVAGLNLPERYKGYSMEHAKETVQAIYNELKK